MGEKVLVHINGSLSHQVQHGKLLLSAFKKHGYRADVVNTPEGEADIHVVSGPHFAKNRWLNHGRTILLDRCYYRGDPDYVSLGWLTEDGDRTFKAGSGRNPPEIKDRPLQGGTIFLADYGGPVERATTVRAHPAIEAPTESLIDALLRHRTAVGYRTTALVTAAIEGLEIICKHPGHILNQPNWLELLPYADWGLHEFDDAIEHLCH